MKNQLLVSEIFGPTIQGEGKSIGQRAAFLRLGGCNLHCSWCDTAYTWRFSDTHPHKLNQVFDKTQELGVMSFEDILSKLMYMDASLLVITGGEPLLQKKELRNFLQFFQTSYDDHRFERVEIETAGTISPSSLGFSFVSFNVSPKLSNSGNSKFERYKEDVLDEFVHSNQAIFKFVVTCEEDFEEIAVIQHYIKINSSQIYIMAEGETAEGQIAAMKWLALLAIEKGYNFTPRLHTLIWGEKRGV